MTNPHRQQVGAILNGSVDNEASVALQALARVFEWCGAVVTPAGLQSMEPDVELGALLRLRELDVALAAGSRWLEALPQLVALAMPNPVVQSGVRGGQEALAAAARQLEGLRTEIDDQIATRDVLLNQQAEAERLERLSVHVEDLERQIRAVEARQSADVQTARQFEERLQSLTEPLVVLSQEALSALQARVRDHLALAAESEEQLRNELETLRDARERYNEAERLKQEEQEVLALYLQADQHVARAFPGAQRVEEALAEAARLLREADAALKAALEARARDDARRYQELPYAERPS